MKHIFITLVSILILINVDAQIKARVTVKKGSDPNSVIIALRPNITFNRAISSFLVVAQVPATVMPRPTLIVKSTFHPDVFPVSAWNILENTSGGFHNYGLSVVTNNPPASDVLSTADFNLIEISFVGLPPEITSKIRLAHMAGAGPETKYQFNFSVGGEDFTDYKKMFYASPSNSIDFPISPFTGGTDLEAEINGYEAYQYSETIDAVVLPVEFKSFYAVKSGDDARLSWDVSADEKNSHFEVLRSTDGRNFQNVQRVNALQNGRSDNSYQTSDLSLSKLGSREIFYQINQTDRDGTQTKSAVRKLSVDGLGKSVTAFPNPARTTTKLVVDAPENGKGAIIMRDALGRQIQNINAQFNKGINHFELKLMNIASGDYNISVMGGGINETIKVTKIN